MIKTNSSRVVEAAADYIDSLRSQGTSKISLETFNGEQCSGTISQQEVHRYNPLKVILTIINSITKKEESFDLSDIASIEPMM